MEVDHCVARIVVAEQPLQDRQFGAVVEQVCSETVAERVWVNGLGDPGATRGRSTGVPHGLVGNGIVGAAQYARLRSIGIDGDDLGFSSAPARSGVYLP